MTDNRVAPYECELCESEYTSSWAAAQCEEECEREAANTRRWWKSAD